jgi:hypothetical protein
LSDIARGATCSMDKLPPNAPREIGGRFRLEKCAVPLPDE